MTKDELKKTIEQNSNIDFIYKTKKYGIERSSQPDDIFRIHFWEWNNTDTFYFTFNDFLEFENQAKIDNQSVVSILETIDDIEIF